MNVFDILKCITYTKDVSLVNDPEFNKAYNQYSVNSFLSAHPNTVHFAMYASGVKMTNKQHFLFLLYALDKEYIYFKREYAKPVNPKIAEERTAISNYYNINMEHAIDIHALLKSEQIDTIHTIYHTKDNIHGKKISKP